MNTRIKNIAGKNILEIDVYGVIGDNWGDDGITPKMVRNALKSGDYDSINVYINSPGGNAFDGVAIYNQLRNIKKTVNVFVDGEAASAASVIAMGGDKVVMRSGALMMIHNASSIAIGQKQDLIKSAETLSRVDDRLADIYATRTGKPINEIKEMMDAETWMDGEEAVDAGFADEIDGEALELVASADAQLLRLNFSNIPNGIQPKVTTPPAIPSDAEDIPTGRDADHGENKESSMPDELKDLTLEQFTASRPDLVDAIKATVDLPDVDALKAEATAEGRKAECERQQAIRAEAKRLRIEDEGEKLIEAETDKDAALAALKDKALESYVAQGPENPGVDGAGNDEKKAETKEQRLIRRANEIKDEKSISFADALIEADKEEK